MSTWFELLLLLLPLLVPLLLTKYVLLRTHPHCSISFQSSPRKVGREVRKKGRKKESFGVLATLFLSFSFTLVPSDPPSSVNGPRWLLLNVSWRQETRKRKIFSIQGFSHPHPLGLSRRHAPLTLCHITYIWASCYLFTVLSIYLSFFLCLTLSLTRANTRMWGSRCLCFCWRHYLLRNKTFIHLRRRRTFPSRAAAARAAENFSGPESCSNDERMDTFLRWLLLLLPLFSPTYYNQGLRWCASCKLQIAQK